MKLLNRIVFINAGDAVYNEINLNGNILLIGSNGTGKSSILRTILFFYNGDPKKLDIRRNQKSFADYYFQTENSYIIYEVKNGEDFYSVILHKSRNTLRYYFADTPYRKDLFVLGDKALTIKEILRNLNASLISCSSAVSGFKNYLSVLYGDNPGSKLEKYSFLEGGNYQTIPRTISNIFINASVEGDFLKKIIINSIEEKQFKLSLDVIERELRQFDYNFSQVKLWKKHENDAIDIVGRFDKLKKLEKERDALVVNMAETYSGKRILEKRVAMKIEALSQEKRSLEADFEKKEAAFKQNFNEQTQEIGKYQNSLETAERKKIRYEKEKIEEKINLAEQKPIIQNRVETEKGKLISLTEKFKDSEVVFEQRKKAIENERISGINSLNERKNKFSEEYNNSLNLIRKHVSERIEKIKEKNEKAYAEAGKTLEEASNSLKNLEIEKTRTKLLPLFDKEIRKLENDIAHVEKKQIVNGSETENALLKKERSLSEFKRMADDLKKQISERKKAVDESLNRIEDKRQVLDEKLKKVDGSFYDFLNKNYPEWWHTIGKVCREDVLLNGFLDPVLRVEKNLFYGVDINLDELKSEIPTVQSFNKKIEELDVEKKEIEKDFTEFVKKQNHEIEVLTRKFKQQESQFIEREKELALEKNTLQQKAKRFKVELDELKARGEKDKAGKIETLEKSQVEAEKRVEAIKKQLAKLKASYKEDIEAERKRESADVEKLRHNFHRDLENLKKSEKELNDRISAEFIALEKEKKSFLEGKGIDYRKIESVEKEIRHLELRLKLIEENQVAIIEYRKDKKEWIDNIGFFNEKIKSHREQREKLEKEFSEFKGKFKSNVFAVEKDLSKNRFLLKETVTDLKKFEAFSKTELFRDIKEKFEKVDGTDESGSLYEFITAFEKNHGICIEKRQTFKSKIITFAGYFKEDNHFGFVVFGQDDLTFDRFAEKLSKFIQNREIEDFEKEIEKQYSILINNVSTKVSELISMEGRIQTIVSKINKSFKNSNFVGVIKSIELKLQENTDVVMTALREIQAFTQEHRFSIGQTSLFNLGDNKPENKKAIELLQKLLKRISEYKKDEILLENAFSLKVRVCENNNDTGWVEKISGVGSNGTDVLVKTMIYITLISVFKEVANRKKRDFKLHCIVDEVGILDNNYLKEMMDFANRREISLIFGAPNENNVLLYDHIYEVRRDRRAKIKVNRIVSKRVLSQN